MSTSAHRLPGGPKARTRSTFPAYVWLFTLFVPLTLFSGHTDEMGVPVPLDRLVFAAAAGLLLLTPAAWRRLRLRMVHKLFLVSVGAILLSAAAAGTLLDAQAMFALLDRVLLPFVLFTIAPVVWSTPARRDLLLRCLVVVAVYLGVTAILEFTAPQLVWPRYIVDDTVGIQFGRARGPFAASEAAGLAMLMTGAASALALSRFRDGWQAIALLGVVVSTVGVALTLTRSVWLGAVLGIVLVCIAERRVRTAALSAGVAVAIIAVVVAAAVPSLTDSFTERATAENPIYDRANTNAAGLRIVADRPFTGIGWRRFTTDAGLDYVRQADDIPLNNVFIEIHNVPLSRAAETGVPAALVYVAAVVASLVVPLLRRKRGDLKGWRLVLLAAVTSWGVSAMLSPVSYPTANYLVWIFAGITMSEYLVRDADIGARTTHAGPLP